MAKINLTDLNSASKGVTNNNINNNTSNNSNNRVNNINDRIEVGRTQTSFTTYNNLLSNTNNRNSLTKIILDTATALDELENIKNGNFNKASVTDINSRIDELGKTVAKLAGIAKGDVNNPAAALVKAEELPLINGVIENAKFPEAIRIYSLWSILNGVIHHNKPIEQSSSNSINKILADENAPEILQKNALIGLAQNAKNGQVLSDDTLDKVNRFVYSKLTEQALLVLYYAKDHSNISASNINELKKVASNPNITGNANKDKTLKNLVDEIITQYDQNTKNKNISSTVNLENEWAKVRALNCGIEEEIEVIRILNNFNNRGTTLQKSDIDLIKKVSINENTSENLKRVCSLALQRATQANTAEMPKNAQNSVVLRGNNQTNNSSTRTNFNVFQSQTQAQINNQISQINKINSIIENPLLDEKTRNEVMTLIDAGAVDNKELIKESTLNSMMKLLEDKNTAEDLKRKALIDLAKIAQNGQILETDILDKISNFIGSNVTEQAVAVLYHADASKFSRQVITKVRDELNSNVAKSISNLDAQYGDQLAQIIKNYNKARAAKYEI